MSPSKLPHVCPYRPSSKDHILTRPALRTLLIQAQPRIPPTILRRVARADILTILQARRRGRRHARGRDLVAAPALLAPLGAGVPEPAGRAEGRAPLVGHGVGRRLAGPRQRAERPVRRPPLLGRAAQEAEARGGQVGEGRRGRAGRAGGAGGGGGWDGDGAEGGAAAGGWGEVGGGDDDEGDFDAFAVDVDHWFGCGVN